MQPAVAGNIWRFFQSNVQQVDNLCRVLASCVQRTAKCHCCLLQALTQQVGLLRLQWRSLVICRSLEAAPLVLHAQVDEDKSGEIEFAEFLRLAERQKQAQARLDNGDTVEAFVALGGKVSTGLA